MKSMTLIVLALTSMSVSASDYKATQIVHWEDRFAMTTLDKSETGIDLSRQGFSASVSYDKNGIQRIYFKHKEVRDGQFVTNCHLGESFESEVWKFADQNVKMTTYCDETEGAKYLTATPETDAGAAFVINAFKNSAGGVKIVPASFQQGFKMSAKGFTKVWNNGGGNAI
jgi:hypothetical protein